MYRMSEVIAVQGGGSSGQNDEPSFTYIRINLNIEHGDCRFEIIDQKRYVVYIEDNAYELTTAVCENSKYLPQLLATGGSVMVVCYALYKLGYSAGEFSTGCLDFVLKVEPAKLETVRRQLTKGRFVESLQDEVDAIIEGHTTALAHLKNFTIQSAKEISITKMAKQSSLVSKASNLNLTEPVPNTSNPTHCREEVQEPSSNTSENSDGHGDLSSDDLPVDVQDTGNGGSAPTARNAGDDIPAGTQEDAVLLTNQSDDNDKCTSMPFKYHVGIFAHGNDKFKANRIKSYCDSLRYNTCIYSEWVVRGGGPLPKKVIGFIEECWVLFWIASPQHTVGSYMDHWKNVAHDISIRSKNSRFVVVITRECLQQPKEEILPPELMPYDPIKEDTKIIERIKTTVESTTKLPAANYSQPMIPFTLNPPIDVPGPSITTNIYNISDSSVGNLHLPGLGEPAPKMLKKE